MLAQEAKAGTDVVQLRDSTAYSSSRLWLAAPSEGLGVRKARRSTLLFAFAASVLVLAGAAWMLLDRAQHYDTAVGEQRSVALSDGSVVTLNAASSITVEMSRGRRTIRLLSGEALFQVAHDAVRPFDVLTADTAVRAV